jgi:hypothetical protein
MVAFPRDRRCGLSECRYPHLGTACVTLCIKSPASARTCRSQRTAKRQQDAINREAARRSEDMPQHRTFSLGLDFIERNQDADRWMLQIETFDPHEPFFSQKECALPGCSSQYPQGLPQLCVTQLVSVGTVKSIRTLTTAQRSTGLNTEKCERTSKPWSTSATCTPRCSPSAMRCLAACSTRSTGSICGRCALIPRSRRLRRMAVSAAVATAAVVVAEVVVESVCVSSRAAETTVRVACLQDTMLVVNTDHGFLMGEHDWWAKVVNPFFNEVAHIPMWIYDPTIPHATGQRQALVQTIDLAPTILHFFGLPIPSDTGGSTLGERMLHDTPARKVAIYGVSHVPSARVASTVAAAHSFHELRVRGWTGTRRAGERDRRSLRLHARPPGRGVKPATQRVASTRHQDVDQSSLD